MVMEVGVGQQVGGGLLDVLEFTKTFGCGKIKNALAVVVAGCDKSMNGSFLQKKSRGIGKGKRKKADLVMRFMWCSNERLVFRVTLCLGMTSVEMSKLNQTLC